MVLGLRKVQTNDSYHCEENMGLKMSLAKVKNNPVSVNELRIFGEAGFSYPEKTKVGGDGCLPICKDISS